MMNQPIVKIKKLGNFQGVLPQYQTHGAAGCDLCANLPTQFAGSVVSEDVNSSVILKPGERALIPTALSFEIPEGYEIQIRPRSGLAFKNGVSVVNAPGTIDSDYRGELKILLINHGDKDFVISHGDRIAQMVIAPVVQAVFEWSDALSDTVRGAGGFGSTGVNAN